jgi:hypothetical protein
MPSTDPRGTRFLKHENCAEKRLLRAFDTARAKSRHGYVI